MAQNAVEINGQNLPVREYEGVRVVTLNDVARVHDVKEDQIRRNFNRNRKHYIENVDFFRLRGKEMCDKYLKSIDKPRVNIGTCLDEDGNKTLGGSTITQMNLFTESGYLMLVKSLTDDVAWEVQRMLVTGYFKVKQVERVHEVDNSLERLVQIFPLLEDVYKQIIYYRAEKGLTQYETSKVLGLTRKAIYNREKELREAGVMLPRQNNAGNKYNLTVLKALAEVK